MLSTANSLTNSASGNSTDIAKLNGAKNNNNNTNITNLNTVEVTFDESNHVSYSFSFFLHGASRVCTSVDIKMHRPIRLINKFDLIKLRNNMKNFFQYKSASNRLAKQHGKHRARRKQLKQRFRGTSVILGPYGVSARLVGYLSNECVESKMTCVEWQQFYPLKLNQTIPNVLVIAGLDKANKLKFFYPNSFVYIVMDSDNEDEDDSQDDTDKNNEEKVYASPGLGINAK